MAPSSLWGGGGPLPPKQMIMGAGKTTVVSPLLALMLADGHIQPFVAMPPSFAWFCLMFLHNDINCVCRSLTPNKRNKKINAKVLKKVCYFRSRIAIRDIGTSTVTGDWPPVAGLDFD